MKNTVKLFEAMFSIAIITLVALIGFAACDNNPEDEDITWSAVADGAAGTTSTKIAFTFGEAVTGLTANDITLTNGTGAATKGTLTGSGTSWELGITVTSAGTVSVKITKDGVSAIAKDVTVYKAGGGGGEPEHPISGRTTWVFIEADGMSYQVVFSTISGNSGTYQLNDYNWNSEDWDQPAGEGTYTWNESAETVTLTASKISMMDPDTWEFVLMTEGEAETVFSNQMKADAESEIAYYVMDEDDGGMGMSEEEAEEFFLEYYNDMLGTNYTTIDDYIDGEVARKLEAFGPRPYTYVYSNDGASLILLEALPAPVGSDELAGKTFYGTTFNWETMLPEKDESQSYVFSAAGKTFTATIYDPFADATSSVTGSYSYDSTTKQVYLKQDTINGQTPAQFFDAVEPDEYSNYPTEADDRAAQTTQTFTVEVLGYDSEENTLSIGGGISGLSSTRQRSR